MSALLPWETPIEGFFIRTHHGVPVIDGNAWRLVIDGLVEKPLELTLKQIKSMPTSSLHAVLECSGNGRALQVPRAGGVQWGYGAVGNAEWTGASLAAVLAKAGVKREARFARIEGADKPTLPSVPGFVRSIPLAKILAQDTLLAWKMNREPMPVLHGGPLRLILPNWYGQNWLKWVTRITLTANEDDGFFMKKGYRMPRKPLQPGEAFDAATGEPVTQLLVQSLIVYPLAGVTVPRGELLLKGKAFSGAGAITKVEVSKNGGKSWEKAQIEPPHSTGGWQGFQAAVLLNEAGSVELMARATDQTGATQPLEHQWNPAGYLRNAVQRVALTVGEQGVLSGRELLHQRCTMCHSQLLVTGQRLSRKQWEGVVGKMKGFGAPLTAAEEKTLLDYLADLLPPEKATEPPHVIQHAAEASDYSEVVSRDGDVAAGAKVFATHCATCHGAKGEGSIGPRLAGRAVPKKRFESTVRFGRGIMPAFDKILRQTDVADARAFLQRHVQENLTK